MVPPNPPPSAPADAAGPLRYHLVVLCLWQERGAGGPVWRFSLENPQTAERLGFGTLAALGAYLQAWTRDPPAGAASPSAKPDQTVTDA